MKRYLVLISILFLSGYAFCKVTKESCDSMKERIRYLDFNLVKLITHTDDIQDSLTSEIYIMESELYIARSENTRRRTHVKNGQFCNDILKHDYLYGRLKLSDSHSVNSYLSQALSLCKEYSQDDVFQKKDYSHILPQLISFRQTFKDLNIKISEYIVQKRDIIQKLTTKYQSNCSNNNELVENSPGGIS